MPKKSKDSRIFKQIGKIEQGTFLHRIKTHAVNWEDPEMTISLINNREITSVKIAIFAKFTTLKTSIQIDITPKVKNNLTNKEIKEVGLFIAILLGALVILIIIITTVLHPKKANPRAEDPPGYWDLFPTDYSSIRTYGPYTSYVGAYLNEENYLQITVYEIIPVTYETDVAGQMTTYV